MAIGCCLVQGDVFNSRAVSHLRPSNFYFAILFLPCQNECPQKNDPLAIFKEFFRSGMLNSVQKIPGSRVSFVGEGRETVKALLISDNRHVRGLGKKTGLPNGCPVAGLRRELMCQHFSGHKVKQI
jgi:hypothetical protein